MDRAKRDAFETWLRVLPDKGLTLRVLAFVAVLLLALGFLILINWLLRGGGLWGDLVFAIVIMTLALWTLRRLQLSWFHRDDRFVLTRALAATLVVLIGIPIALVNQLAGALIIGGAFLAWLVVAIVRKLRKESVPRSGRPRSRPSVSCSSSCSSRSRSRLRTSCPRPRRSRGRRPRARMPSSP